MTRVLLLVPPFHSLTAPSLGISLLKASFVRLGIEADVLYLNLRFGSVAGRDLYDLIAGNARALTGDWLFAGELFDGPLPDPQAYLNDIVGERLGFGPDLVARLSTLRQAVPAFLDEAVESIAGARYEVVVSYADLGVGEDRIQNCAGLAFFRRLKAQNPQIVTVMGGANCQGGLGAILHEAFPFVDYVCAGEGDRILPHLVERVLAGETVTDVPGLIGRAGSHPASAVVSPPLVRDLDGLPYPDFDDFFGQFRAANLGPGEGPILVFEASRGCWWGEKHHCTFCGLNGVGMQYRSKSPQRALDELDYLVTRHQVRSVFAMDMILNPRYFDTFLAALAERRWPPSLFLETKANLTKDQLRVLARAGVRELQPGVESLSTPILRLMDKGVTALQNVRVLKWCAEIGVRPFWNILYGFPSESPAEYERMARLVPSLMHLPAPYRMLQIRMVRFSPNFDRSEALGFVNVRPAAAYGYVYPRSFGDPARLAYDFDFNYADGRDPSTYTQALGQQVERWRSAGAAARLEMRLNDDELEIEDSRPGAARPTTVLRGPARLAYLALDAGATAREVTARLEQALGAAAPGSERVEVWCEEWLADQLVLREDGRYLSLAVNPAQRIPLPTDALLARMTAVVSER